MFHDPNVRPRGRGRTAPVLGGLVAVCLTGDHRHRYRHHAYFGLQTVPIPASAATQAGTPGGLYVSGVQPGGPSAGLEVGDIVTRIDGQAASSTRSSRA
jgi:S1-C subfamily serine protease